MEKGAEPDNVSGPRMVAQNAHWAGRKTFEGMEFVGEIAANFMGLTKSRYQWVIDQAERDEEARKQKEAKKGARLRKAGAKHNKFDAEAAGKTKNKKNGLVH